MADSSQSDVSSPYASDEEIQQMCIVVNEQEYLKTGAKDALPNQGTGQQLTDSSVCDVSPSRSDEDLEQSGTSSPDQSGEELRQSDVSSPYLSDEERRQLCFVTSEKEYIETNTNDSVDSHSNDQMISYPPEAEVSSPDGTDEEFPQSDVSSPYQSDDELRRLCCVTYEKEYLATNTNDSDDTQSNDQMIKYPPEPEVSSPDETDEEFPQSDVSSPYQSDDELRQMCFVTYEKEYLATKTNDSNDQMTTYPPEPAVSSPDETDAEYPQSDVSSPYQSDDELRQLCFVNYEKGYLIDNSDDSTDEPSTGQQLTDSSVCDVSPSRSDEDLEQSGTSSPDQSGEELRQSDVSSPYLSDEERRQLCFVTSEKEYIETNTNDSVDSHSNDQMISYPPEAEVSSPDGTDEEFPQSDVSSPYQSDDELRRLCCVTYEKEYLATNTNDSDDTQSNDQMIKYPPEPEVSSPDETDEEFPQSDVSSPYQSDDELRQMCFVTYEKEYLATKTNDSNDQMTTYPPEPAVSSPDETDAEYPQSDVSSPYQSDDELRQLCFVNYEKGYLIDNSDDSTDEPSVDQMITYPPEPEVSSPDETDEEYPQSDVSSPYQSDDELRQLCFVNYEKEYLIDNSDGSTDEQRREETPAQFPKEELHKRCGTKEVTLEPPRFNVQVEHITKDVPGFIESIMGRASPDDSPGVLDPELLELKIKDAKRVFVETNGYKEARKSLQEHGYVTITGGVGEGKTTMALMLGVEYRQQGYQLVMVEDVDKFKCQFLVQASTPYFVVFDDIFGSVGFRTEVRHLEKTLNHLDILMAQAENVPSTLNNIRNFMIAFTSKTYNLRDGLKIMGDDKMTLFFHREATIDLSEKRFQLTPGERGDILINHERYLGRDCYDKKPDITTSQFGFPLICRMFFGFNRSKTNRRTIFTNPLAFLTTELTVLLSERSRRSAALILMLLCEGTIYLSKLEIRSDDTEFEKKIQEIESLISNVTRTEISSAAKSLRGTFFTEGDVIGFTHPVMYDACAVALASQNIAFVLKHCTLKFLYERVRPCTEETSVISDDCQSIDISSSYYELFTDRLIQGIEEGKYAHTLTHPMLKETTIQDMFLQRLFSRVEESESKQVETVPKYDVNEMIKWIVQGQNIDLLLTFFSKIQTCSSDTIHILLKECSSCGNSEALEWILAKYGHTVTENIICQALLLAAQNKHAKVSRCLTEFASQSSHIVIAKPFMDPDKIPPEVFFYMTLSQLFDSQILIPLFKVIALSGNAMAFSMLTKLYELFEEDLHETNLQANTILHLACEGGSKPIVEHLLPFFEINRRGLNGCTPVMIAADGGKKEVFDLLVTKGADLTLTDNSGDTVLHLACKGGNTSIVDHLLQSFDINNRGQNGWTPVMIAAGGGKKEVFDLLVTKGADLTLTDNSGDTVLNLACHGGKTSIVDHLLHSFDINIRGHNGWTPVMDAAISGKTEVFDLLVTKGADLALTDNNGNDVLHLACHRGNTTFVDHLLPLFDINFRGKNGWTPLDNAAIGGKKEIYDLLVTKGADLTLTDNNGNTVLHHACLGGNKSILEHILQSFDINSRGNNGWTPVMNAAISGKKEVFDLLVTKGADLTLTDNNGNTVLHHACLGGNKSILEHILQSFDINSRGNNGWTPVMNAAISGKKEVFDLLVTKGADLTLTDNNGNTVLHHACLGGNKSILEHILQSFDINSRGNNGWTPVMNAAISGKKEVFDLLVTKGADLTLTDNNGNTVLYHACLGGNKSILEHILQSFDINSRGNNGWTPVMNAAISGKKEVFDLLVTKGADLTLTDNNGNNVLHQACQGGNTSFVDHLLPSFDINNRGQNGWTPVMVAAGGGKKEVFDLLVSKGADLTLTDNKGNTVLHLACHGGNTSIVEHLLSSFDINNRGQNGWTPVIIAAIGGKKEVFDLLVSKGADLTLTDNNGNNVLHQACQGRNTSIVEHLLPSFDINNRGHNGWTPVIVAAYSGRKEVFDLLVTQGADLTLTGNDGNTVLHHACHGGNTSIVDHLLPSFDINNRGQNGWTPAMIAAICGQKEVFDLLLTKGAVLTLTDNYGNTVLNHACQEGHTRIVEYLLPLFDINNRGQNGCTPVMGAAFGGTKEVLDLLVTKGADLTLTDNDGNTVLHHACCGGNIDIVRYTLPLYDVNLTGGNSHTPLMRAVSGGHIDVVDFLVSNNADLNMVDDDGDSLLHLACGEGNIAMVKRMLPFSDIHLRDKLGWTPLMHAIVNGKLNVFQFLVDKGASLDVVDNVGDDVLTLAYHGGCQEIIQQLTPCGEEIQTIEKWTKLMHHVAFGHFNTLKNTHHDSPDLLQRDGFGDTLLHLACRGGDLKCVEYILPCYDINVRGRYDWTPVMMAARCGHLDVCQYLIGQQADLSLVSDTGEDVLNLACRGKNVHVIGEMLSRDEFAARVLHVSLNGNTLLHLACIGGNVENVEHLLPDCDINVRGQYDLTPVIIAALCGHMDVLQCLISHKADLSLVSDTGEYVLNRACRGKSVKGVGDSLSKDEFAKKKGRVTLNGNTLLHLACIGGNVENVEHLLPDYDINVKGRYGWTPVMMAALCGHIAVLQCLISHKADLSLVFDTGEDVLNLAYRGKSVNVIGELLSRDEFAKRKVFVSLEGNTLLHLACIGGNVKNVERLLPDYDINVKGQYDWTPVMMAAYCEHLGLLQCLISHKADLSRVSDKGEDVLCLARRGTNTDIVTFLLTLPDFSDTE